MSEFSGLHVLCQKAHAEWPYPTLWSLAHSHLLGVKVIGLQSGLLLVIIIALMDCLEVPEGGAQHC